MGEGAKGFFVTGNYYYINISKTLSPNPLRNVGCVLRTNKGRAIGLPFVIFLWVGRASVPAFPKEFETYETSPVSKSGKKRADTQVRPYRSLVIGFLLKADR